MCPSFQIIDNETKEAAVVDPIKPDAVMQAVEEARVNLSSVLTTHHHWDHAGGNDKLVKICNKGELLKVYGGDERINAMTNKVTNDDKFSIGNLSVRCISTPGHTSGHICYYVEAPNEKRALFSGILV